MDGLSKLISPMCLFAIGMVALLAATYSQPEQVQTIQDTSVLYVGFAGRFLAWLSIAMLSSVILSSKSVPTFQRSAVAVLLFLMGISVVIIGPSPRALLQMLRSNPVAVVSGYQVGVFSVVALISVPFLLAAGTHGKQRAFLQFNLLQIIGATLLACLLSSIVPTRGAFAFHYFAALTLLGVIGARLAGVKRNELAFAIAPVGVITITMAALFALNHYGFTDWIGPSPKLVMFTTGGVVPLLACVTIAVLFTGVATMWTHDKFPTTEPCDEPQRPAPPTASNHSCRPSSDAGS